MNITIITILLPYPLDSGGAQAQYNMIEKLRKKHHITIIYPENQHNGKASLAVLQEKWQDVDFRPYPFLRQARHPHFLASKIRRALKLRFCKNSNRFQIERTLQPYGYDLTKDFIRFTNDVIAETKSDIVQVEFYPYLHLIHYLPKDIKRIFVHHEIRYVRNLRTLHGLHPSAKDIAFAETLKQEEIQDLNAFDEVITLTDVDKGILRKDDVTTQIDVSPAGVSTKEQPYKEWNKTITFVGGSGHAPNVEGLTWLFGQVFPLVDWRRWDGITFRIIGKGWKHEDFPPTEGLRIENPGFVESLADAMSGGIMLIPILSGSGMRMKILEGAALSMPILTTTVGVEGIDLTNMQSCIIKDNPHEFADALQALFEDSQLRKRIGMEANRIFHQKYSVDALAEIRNRIYINLMDR